MKGKSKVGAMAVAVLAMGLIAGPAEAVSSSPPTLPDKWSVETYTKAALEHGYSPDIIDMALRDPEVFGALVVETRESSSTSTRAARESDVLQVTDPEFVAQSVITTSHSRTAYNGLGQVVRRLTLNKQFQANGLRVYQVSSSYSYVANSNLGESWGGVNGTQEYYTNEGGRANGGHTSWVSGNFENAVLQGSISYWVQIKGLWNGTVIKSAGG